MTEALVRHDVVVPTVGRPSLARLLAGLAAQRAPGRASVVVVDDRPVESARRTPLPGLDAAPEGTVVVRSHGRGPAAARNAGWRVGTAPWVVFLDDDVELTAGWSDALDLDLGRARRADGGSQGRIEVPLPTDRKPTDWERSVAGLAAAEHVTADCAYRRGVLEAVGGFDERFPRAYREDAELAARVLGAGWSIARGDRCVRHPVRPAPWWISLAKQRGNVDDAAMRRLHGPSWRRIAAAPRGRLPGHVATVAAAGAALAASQARWRRSAWSAAGAWAALTAELAWHRLRPGPRDAREVATILATSVALPFAAVGWRALGEVRARRLRPSSGASSPLPDEVEVVLVDRDGTLVIDVPYNGDPERVDPLPGVARTLAALRAAGIDVAIVTNQSGIGRGRLDHAQVVAVNRRVEDALGPFAGTWYCPHAPAEGCGCRKPEPGLLLAALGALEVSPARAVFVGDTGADVEAARRAGVASVLVADAVTRTDEIAAAPLVVATFADVGALLVARAPASRSVELAGVRS